MKKTKIGIWVVIFIILGFIFCGAYIGYRAYIGQELAIITLKVKLKEYSRYDSFIYNSDDNNLPDYQKQFYPYDYIKDNEKEFIKITIPDNYDELYSSAYNKQLVLAGEAMFSQYIDSVKDIVSIMKNRMKEKKKNIPPSFKESESFPLSPDTFTVRKTCKYWYILSRLLEKRKDYETSLFLALATFYLSKDIQTNYINSGGLTLNMESVIYNQIACKSILLWASKPKPDCQEVSKEIAKDILDLVKADYPFSKIIENRYFMFNDMLYFYESKASTIFACLPKSKKYCNTLNVLFKEPMSFFDEPLYKIMKQIKASDDKIDKLISTVTDQSNITYYSKYDPDMLICARLIIGAYPFFSRAKCMNEVGLARMEMAAIALVINSYVCENNKYPESMEELSKWFGRELPKDRLTNEPYKLDFKGKHVLYNEYLDYSSKEKKDFYFNFSLE